MYTASRGFNSPLGLLAVLASMALPASATLIVSERFDYSSVSGTSLTHTLSGGTSFGWSGGWTRFSAANSSGTFQNNDIFVGTLPPAGGTPTTLGGSANKAANQNASHSRATSSLSTHFDTAEDEVWFSFMFAVRNPYDGDINLGFSTSTADSTSGIGITLRDSTTSGTSSIAQLYVGASHTSPPAGAKRDP